MPVIIPTIIGSQIITFVTLQKGNSANAAFWEQISKCRHINVIIKYFIELIGKGNILSYKLYNIWLEITMHDSLVTNIAMK